MLLMDLSKPSGANAYVVIGNGNSVQLQIVIYLRFVNGVFWLF
jgi:hypothetical protein